MDEPVPIRRAAVGCLLVAVAGLAAALAVRPAIFTFSTPRDDAAVIVATATEARAGPVRRDVILSRAYGWDGERDAGDGRVQVAIIVGPSRFGGLSAVAAASPVADDCPVEIGADRLTDCDGRGWTFEGLPLDSSDPPLNRFPVEVVSGAVTVDLTRIEEPSSVHPGTERASVPVDAPSSAHQLRRNHA